MTTPAQKKPITTSVDAEVADRLEREANDRVIGKGLLVEKAIVFYLDRLPPLDLAEAQDRVSIPQPGTTASDPT